jgi:predicted secreted protein
MRKAIALLALVAAFGCAPVLAQTPLTPPPAKFEGPVVLMTGTAELELPNDEAFATFYLEVQEADLAKAQSALNARVAEGVAQLKRADPRAQIETAGYGSYPVYASAGARKITGWRVRQGVHLKTSDLTALPRTVAAGQAQLALGGIDFRVSQAAREKAEADLITRAIANANARINAAAQAVGVPPARVRLEELNFGLGDGPRPPIAMMRARAASTEAVAEPSFDAGQSTLQMAVTARARFLAP